MSGHPTMRLRRCREGHVPGLRGTAFIALVVGLMLGSAVGSARAAGDRLAVLIVAEQDPELSDNLTEVAISKLAERREHRLVGWRELHEQLSEILAGQSIGDCLDNPRCLARIGAAAQVDFALIGEVRREAERFVVRLVLVNARSAGRDAECSESVGTDLAQLISAVRRGTRIVSDRKPTKLTLEPARAQVVSQAGTSPTGSPMLSVGQAPTHRARWVTPLGYATGGLGVVSLSAAVVTGSLASAKPIGSTRAETQTDLERRERYAGIANSLYLVGAALALTAIVMLVRQARHP
jgi:hypothetical protein